MRHWFNIFFCILVFNRSSYASDLSNVITHIFLDPILKISNVKPTMTTEEILKVNKKLTKKSVEEVYVVFDQVDLKDCQRVARVIVPDSSGVSKHTLDCRVDYFNLKRKVLLLGGDTLYISHYLNRCLYSTYFSYAYKCK